MRKGTIGGVALAIILIIIVIIGFACTEKIPAGYAGVVYNMSGGIEDDILTQGWNFVSPTKKVTKYSISMEQSYLSSKDVGDSPKNESFNVPTSDGKTVRVDLEFSYMFDPERLPETYTLFKGKNGEDIKETFIKPKVMAWTQEVTANYPVTDLYGDKRTEINEKLDSHLKTKFDAYGIIIDTVNFTDISVDAETEAAIQKKVTAQENLELAKTEAEIAQVNANKEREVARIEAEKDKEVAQIAAEKAIIEAEAEAEALKIAAEAEAEANREVAASLTDELIEKIKYEQWDGKMPAVTGTTGGTIIGIDGIG